MKFIRLGLLSFVAGLSAFAQANSSDTMRLIESCRELAAITDRHMNNRTTTAFTTSVAEAMRAGFCHGVLEQYARENYWCEGTPLYQQVQKVISFYRSDDTFSETAYDLDDILRSSCGR